MADVKSTKRIFKEEALQRQFDEDGYVCIPFLEQDEVETLVNAFHQHHNNIIHNAFGSSSFKNDAATKRAISDTILAIFDKKYQHIFCDYNPLGGAFLYKTKGENSDLAPHQDWTIVDEEQFVALNVWVPLTDTNLDNGTLQVVPKTSYPYIKTLRAPTIPFFFEGNENQIIEHAKAIPTKAGHAIILNESLIHYSAANISQDIRIAITAGVISAGAPMLFHYKNENSIEQFEVEYDFLIDIENFDDAIYQKPKKFKRSKHIDFNLPKLNKQQLIDFLNTQQYQATASKSLFQKIKCLISNS